MEDIKANTDPDIIASIPTQRELGIAGLFLRNDEVYNHVFARNMAQR